MTGDDMRINPILLGLQALFKGGCPKGLPLRGWITRIREYAMFHQIPVTGEIIHQDIQTPSLFLLDALK
jgi:hypothetical protein